MVRIMNYDICAFLILIILIFSIYLHRMTKGEVNRAFLVLVYSCLVTTMFDLAVELFRPNNAKELVVEKILTYGYYFSRSINAISYIVYLIRLTDTWHIIKESKWSKVILTIPAIVDFVAVITNEYTGFIFYFNEEMQYTRGDYIIIRYICLFFFIVYGFYFICKYRKLFSRGKRIAVFAMFPMTIIAQWIQYVYPTMLVEMFATTLAILVLIITVQRPDENINANFGVRNYQAFWSDLRRTFYNEKPVHVLYIHIINYNSLNSTLGETSTRELVKKSILPMNSICKKYHAKSDLYYLNHGCFAIVLDACKPVETDAIAKDIDAMITHDEHIRKSGLTLNVQICILRCPEDAKDYTSASVIYNVLKNQTETVDGIMHASDVIAEKDFEIKSRIDSIINEAFENKRFEVYYQPIYSTKERKFKSAEALLRLHDETYGFVSPELFIPAAEKSGAIHKIGEFVFEEVCRFIKSKDFEALGMDYIEINLSVAQCMQTSLAKDLLKILHKYDVSPKKINLEITETAVESSFDTMMDNLNALSEEGITFSLDDYGTGFSNIQRIIQMPLSIVKLDKSFIDDIHNPEYQVIVTNTIKMLKDLNLEIVSEGVEGEKQLGFLHEQKCDFIQGYYFSKPLPRKEFVSFIKKHS